MSTEEFIKIQGSNAPFKKGEGAVLPVEGKRNVLITSALPYVNNVPHLGNIIGCVLSADVFARYSRLRGYNTLFVCGTDEYGTATENKAMEEGVSPKEICDKYNAIHDSVYKWFDISFDHFGRTSRPHQTTIAQDIFVKLYKNGYLKEQTMDQLYCPKCVKFLADRFVEGECPYCGAQDARGDQCDKCTKPLEPEQLKNPRCKLCGTTPSMKETIHQFLDLPKLQDQLKEFAEKSKEKGKWTNNSFSVTEAWLKSLQPRCITRDLKWGVPVPLENEEYKNKVLYVWFDAPIGYISITADYTDDWEKWWKAPEKVDLVMFMGKDNIPFHTVLFPGSQIGTKEPYTLLHSISTTEYLTYEGEKFSKSNKKGVFGDDIQDTGIPSSVWRFYLLMNRPENADADFNWDDFSAKNNNELLANLGNFFNRGLKFLHSNLKGVVQPITLNEVDNQLIQKVNGLIANYHTAFAEFRIKEALRVVLNIGQVGNYYYQSEKPWEAFAAPKPGKDGKVVEPTPEELAALETRKARAASVISLGCALTKLIAIYLEPFVPAVTKEVLTQLNTTHEKLTDSFELSILPEGHVIGEPKPIFAKIEDKQAKALRQRFQGEQKGKKEGEKPTFPASIVLGKILSVENHPSADKLYVMKVDVGEKNKPEGRQVVAGLREHYQLEELKDRFVVVLLNLKPTKFQGVQSEAMLIVAEKMGERVILGLLKPEEEGEGLPAVGTPILPAGFQLEAKPKSLDYRKDFLKLNLGTKSLEEKCRAIYTTPTGEVAELLAGEKLRLVPDREIPGGKLR